MYTKYLFHYKMVSYLPLSIFFLLVEKLNLHIGKLTVQLPSILARSGRLQEGIMSDFGLVSKLTWRYLHTYNFTFQLLTVHAMDRITSVQEHTV